MTLGITKRYGLASSGIGRYSAALLDARWQTSQSLSGIDY